jgi:hypothetical protein
LRLIQVRLQLFEDQGVSLTEDQPAGHAKKKKGDQSGYSGYFQDSPP